MSSNVYVSTKIFLMNKAIQEIVKGISGSTFEDVIAHDFSTPLVSEFDLQALQNANVKKVGSAFGGGAKIPVKNRNSPPASESQIAFFKSRTTGVIWVTKEKAKIDIARMSCRHMRNCIAILEKRPDQTEAMRIKKKMEQELELRKANQVTLDDDGEFYQVKDVEVSFSNDDDDSEVKNFDETIKENTEEPDTNDGHFDDDIPF